MPRFLDAVLLTALACSVSAGSEEHTIILARHPDFSASVTVTDVHETSKITVYVPFQLQDAVYSTPSSNMKCESQTRNIFAAAHEEIGSIVCVTGPSRLPEFTILVNGTLVFEPVRFIVTVCPISDNADIASRCWTNEASWRSPSAYEQLMSCQLVAAGVLVFWFVVAAIMCVCLCRHHTCCSQHAERDDEHVRAGLLVRKYHDADSDDEERPKRPSKSAASRASSKHAKQNREHSDNDHADEGTPEKSNSSI